MTRQTSNFDPSELRPDQCWTKLDEHTQCNDTVAYVLENLRAPGYTKVCPWHMRGYTKWNTGEGISYRVWTIADWNKSGREAEHEKGL